MSLFQKRQIILFFGFLGSISFFTLDQHLKWKALLFPSHNIFGDFFRFQFVKNPYIAFSIPLSGKILFFVISCIIVFLIFWLILSLKKQKIYQSIFFIIIIFGAISNLLDRANFGYVIDYLDLKYFTVFNVADIMISVGFIFLIVLNYLETKKEGSII